MRIQCWHSWADINTCDRLFQLACRSNGWAKTLPVGIEVYIPEELEVFVLLIDPKVIRRSRLDWLV